MLSQLRQSLFSRSIQVLRQTDLWSKRQEGNGPSLVPVNANDIFSAGRVQCRLSVCVQHNECSRYSGQ
ncbi:hypothetical protein Y023_4132 [Burkholderia pseudomallei A79D]|nr:hypothetical protein Y023_4132 [Burkholderia pseudomallei A79D]KGX99912.1 hypothetical protein X997_3825 [Burkholderia pseudomallei A79C]